MVRECAKERVLCPGCGKRRDPKEVLALEQAASAHGATPWWGKPGWALERVLRGEPLRWACEACLVSGRALPAQPWRQTFCDHPPLLAYADEALTCADCRQGFTFGAREQAYWYEQLGFWVQSRPRQCPGCRRSRRQRARAQQELSAVMATLDPKDPEQLARAASALLAVGSRRKAAEFLRRAKNRAPLALRARIVKQLEALEALERDG